MAQRTTIRDVAALAHVSYQTVSRVINDSDLVSGASRQCVQDAMATLNYAPSAAARSLKDGRTQLLGVLVHDNPNPFFGSVVRGIEDVAYDAGYCALVCSPHDARPTICTSCANTASPASPLSPCPRGLIRPPTWRRTACLSSA